MKCENGSSRIEVQVNGKPSKQFAKLQSIYDNADVAYDMYKRSEYAGKIIEGAKLLQSEDKKTLDLTYDENAEPRVFFAKAKSLESDFLENGRTILYENKFPKNELLIPVVITPRNSIVSDSRKVSGNDIHITKDGVLIAFNRDIIIPIGEQVKKLFTIKKESVSVYNSGNTLLETIERNIRNNIPSVKINYIEDGNHYVQNGQVYINRNKLSANAYVHEYAHIFSMVWKHSNQIEFSNTIKELKAQLEGTEYYNNLRKRYSDLSESDFEMELIAQVMEDYTMNKFFDKEMSLKTKNGLIEQVRNLIQKIVRAFNNLFGARVITRFEGMTFAQLEESLFNVMNGTARVRFTTQEIDAMNYFQKYEKREDTDRVVHVKNARGLVDAIITDEQIVSELPIDRQVEMHYARVKKYGELYSVMVNGKQLNFETNDPATIKMGIREHLEKGKNESDNVLKTHLVNIAEKFGSSHEENRVILKKELEVLGYKFSANSVKQLYNIISPNVGTKIVRLSKLEGELTKLGFKFKESIDESLYGYDPIVSIEFVYNQDGVTVPVVSVLDITPESLRFSDSIIGRGHILKRYTRNNVDGLTLNNTKESVRKLMLGMISNALSRNGINVNRAMVVGAYQSEYGRDTIRPSLVDQVEVNANMRAMAGVKQFIEKVNPNLKKEFDASSHIDKQMGYLDALVEYWKSASDTFFDYGIEMNDIREHKSDLERLIALRIKSYEKNKKISSYEYHLLTNALIELNSLPSVNGHYNYKTHLSSISKLIKPGYAVTNDIIQTVRHTLQRISDKLVNKVKEWDKTFESILDAYRNEYPSNALEYVKAMGSKIFEKSFATIDAKDANGMKHKVRINYLLWTTDTKQDPIFAEQAKKLDKKILEANKKIVDMVYNTMIDVVYHEHVNSVGYYKKDGEKYSREDAERELVEKHGYKKGFMPILSKTTGEMVGETSVSDIVRSFIDRQRNAELLYENASKEELLETVQQELNFQLYNDLRGGLAGNFGTSKSLNKIGLRYDMETGEIVVADKNLNDMMSTNLELITKYTVISANRKIEMEQHVVPLANAAMQVMREDYNNGIMNKEEIEYLKMFIEGKIYNKGRVTTGKILGQNVEPVVGAAMKILGTTSLALNVNVAATSMLWNASNIVSEAIGNSFAKLLGEEKDIDFTTSDVTKSVGMLLSNPKLMLAIAHRMNMINENESDIINHWVNIKTKKSLFNEHIAHIGNWATDVVAKVVCMGAQLSHNGSLEAYSINEKGELVYDEKKDKYFEGKEGQLIKKHIKKLFVENGDMENENDKLPFGLDYYSIRKIKTVASKYVLGPYETNERAMLNHFLLGRMFGQFRQFMFSRIDNAFSSGGYIEDIGSWKVVKDVDGKEMVVWEKRFAEGYLISVMNAAKQLYNYVRTGEKVNLNNVQKQNLMRAAARVAVFLMLYMLYNGITDEDDDDDDIGVIGERRFIKNIKFAYQEFLIVSPTLWIRTASSPFAVTSIIARAFDDRFKSSPVNNFAKVLVPGYSTVTTMMELTKSDKTLKQERSQKIKQGIKEAKERKLTKQAQNKQ